MNKFFNQLLRAVPLILMGLTPILWFFGKGSVIIDGVDTNFPLNPAIWFFRRFYIWNGTANAGSDFASSTAGLFFHLIQFIPYQFGLFLQSVQIVSLVFWFLLIIFSAHTLAKILLPKFYLGQILITAFYSFNIYLFNTWENVKVANLSLTAALPFGLAILLLLRENKIKQSKALLFSSLTGVVLSGSGINPAYFICFFLVIFLYILSETIFDLRIRNINLILKNTLTITIPIILVNLFWLMPTTYFIFSKVSSSDSINSLGFNNWIYSLSQNTSLFNVLRLQGAWDWYAFDSLTGTPLFIPYALNFFYNLPFIFFSLLIPGLALVSLILWKKAKGYLYLSFSLMLLIGVFLGVGIYLPTGIFYRWLIDHLPFFTLFRSPWYIFTPLVTLSYACLIGLLYGCLKEIDLVKTNWLLTKFISGLAIILIIGNFVYSYPLLTGKIFRPQRQDGFYLNFPGYVFQSESWLSQEKEGRIISYPDDEIENLNWGYRGIESILELLAEREVLFMPLNGPASGVTNIIRQFYQSLRKDQFSAVKSIAGKLNIKTIFEKQDQKSLASGLPISIKQLPRTNIGNWAFYSLDQNGSLPKIFSTNSLFFVYPYQKSEIVTTALDSRDLLLNPLDTVISHIPAISDFSNTIILTKNSQADTFYKFKTDQPKLSNRLLARDLSKVTFSFDLPLGGSYQPMLERYQLESFGLDLAKNLEVELDGKTVSLEIVSISDSFIYFKPINLGFGRHNINIKLNNSNLINGGSFDQGETFRRGGEGKGEGLYQIEDSGKEKYLSITNIDKADIAADFDVANFNYLSSYYIEAKYKQIYGNNGGILISQSKGNVLFKAEHERMPNYPEWRTLSFYYKPVEVDSKMTVSLTAPYINDPLGTKMFYKDLKVQKIFFNNLLLINRNEGSPLIIPLIRFERKSPVLYSGEVKDASRPHLIVFSENYSPDWEISLYDASGQFINKTIPHFSANYFANAWFIEDVPSSYRFKIYYKPQNFFNLGLGVSLGSFLVFLGIYLLRRRLIT